MRRIAGPAVVACLLAALPAGAAVGAAPPPPAGEELARLAAPPVVPPIASQRLYFVLTDRYDNGNPANDRGGRTGPRAVTGFDPSDPGWYHGGDLRGLTGDCSNPRRGLARIRDLGFNAIWITPPYVQRTVQADSAAYHGYWIVDFTTVDPHLGTEQDFGAFVECAHRLGLKVYLDVVVNHTADVVSLRGGTAWIGPEQKPYRDCHGKPFVPARYAARSTFPCLKASNMPHVPFVLPGDRTLKRPAWLNDVRRYHNRGDIDFASCSELCYEQGDFFGLDDLFTEQPVVMRGLADVYASWIRRYRIDGFRIDTARHVNAAFFRLWLPRILAAARAAGVDDFQLFGEVFLPNAIDLSVFVRDRGLPNVLDFPMQDALVRFAGGSAGAQGIADRLADDDYFRTASGIEPTPPTFLGNHDIGHAALKIRDQMAGGGDAAELLRRVLLGHSLLYLLRGAPVVYYGDEVGIIGRGGDKEARHDLFPTQVDEWQTEARVGGPPIGTGSSFDVAGHPVAEHLRLLAALREAHPALSAGPTVVRAAQRSLLVVSRIDPSARREYVVAFNAGTAAGSVTVATSSGSVAWRPLLGGVEPSTSGADGALPLRVPPLTAVVLRADSDLPVEPAPRPTVRVVGDDLSDLWRVTAQIAGSTASVGFAVRRSKGGWQRLAVDDSPPYRAFLDPTRFRRNEQVYVVAVARGLDGSTSVSPVVPFVVRRR